jgi:hypothetical protein
MPSVASAAGCVFAVPSSGFSSTALVFAMALVASDAGCVFAGFSFSPSAFGRAFVGVVNPTLGADDSSFAFFPVFGPASPENSAPPAAFVFAIAFFFAMAFFFASCIRIRSRLGEPAAGADPIRSRAGVLGALLETEVGFEGVV